MRKQNEFRYCKNILNVFQITKKRVVIWPRKATVYLFGIARCVNCQFCHKMIRKFCDLDHDF